MRDPQELNPGLEDRMNFRSWTPKWLLPFAACGANRLAPSGLLVLPLARANLSWTPGGAGPLCPQWGTVEPRELQQTPKDAAT